MDMEIYGELFLTNTSKKTFSLLDPLGPARVIGIYWIIISYTQLTISQGIQVTHKASMFKVINQP